MRTILLLAALGSGATPAADLPAAAFAPAQLEALITDARLDEISGIAASRRNDGIFWVHNDSPKPAELCAIDTRGNRRACLRIEGVRAVDWEDIASYQLDGKSWLLIGDIGDNGGVRKDYELIAVEEPDLSAEPPMLSVKPAWRQRFRYPDGSHDAEAMAIDVRSREILLINKHAPLALYSLPLDSVGSTATSRVARRLASIDSIPQPAPSERLARFPAARFGGSPTGMDIDAEGRRAIVLTYRDAWLFPRAPGETWQTAFSRTPQRLALPPLAQAEAIAFDRLGRSIHISGERLPAPLLRLDPADQEPAAH